MKKFLVLIIVCILTLSMVIAASGMEVREGPQIVDATKTLQPRLVPVNSSGVNYVPEFVPTWTPPGREVNPYPPYLDELPTNTPYPIKP
jgi:hypothetical protein